NMKYLIIRQNEVDTPEAGIVRLAVSGAKKVKQWIDVADNQIFEVPERTVAKWQRDLSVYIHQRHRLTPKADNDRGSDFAPMQTETRTQGYIV
ncbi:MAG: hypothetical protein AAFX02_08570, partial [Pseudomonadota bacterium]